ncbi:MAG: translation initiation factor IF-2 [Clostridia bacterium]|nr:translation initiation factor IF-2 [Clostridia bacterium]
MAKKTIKLSQLSKDFAMKSKDVLDAFKDLGLEKKSGANADDMEFALFFQKVTKANQIENLDDYVKGVASIRAEKPAEEAKPVEEAKPAAKAEEKPAASAAEPKPEVKAAPKAEPKPEVKAAPAPAAEMKPAAEPKPAAETKPAAKAAPAPKAEPKPEVKAEEKPAAPKAEPPKPAYPMPRRLDKPLEQIPPKKPAQPQGQRGGFDRQKQDGRDNRQGDRPQYGRRPENNGYGARPQENPFARKLDNMRREAQGFKPAGSQTPVQRPQPSTARPAQQAQLEKLQKQQQAAASKPAAPAPKKEEKKAQKQQFKTITPTVNTKDVKGGVNIGGEYSTTQQKTRVVDMRTSDVNLSKYDDRYNEQFFAIANGTDSKAQKQKLKKQDNRGQFSKSAKDKERAAQEKIKRMEAELARKKQLEITVPDEITVSELALRLKKSAAEVIKRLMLMGEMKGVNDILDYGTAELIADEFGAKVTKEVVVTIEEKLFTEAEDTEEDLVLRAPVVCVMGHVDHGKTSILDAIRHTNVTRGEAGGITQAIGAYRVKAQGQDITFLDTPGHEAFTAMRMRGAKSTDIAILVVAADDGVMPQTVEAISHAKAAGIDIIVAINKMDKPTANPDNILNQLTQYDLVPEQWGGDVICVPVSALTGMGISDLLDSVLLVAEVKELRANPNKRARGLVIESRLDRGQGPVATILVQNGTLHQGDYVIVGNAVGRVRLMKDDKGKSIKSAGPSVPVEITGLDDVPQAGDELNAVEDERMAKDLAEQRKEKLRQEILAANARVNLDDLFNQIAEGTKTLNVIVKADVAGSAEAVKASLLKLSGEEVKVSVIHSAVGGITESDVMLATASNAIIVGFNVRPDKNALDSAERNKVDIRTHRIIYEIIDEIEAAMKGMLAPTYKEVLLGHAEVRQTIRVPNVGTIAGSYIRDGKITRQSQIRVVRDGIVIFEDKISSLRRFKDDVKEVAEGYECGVGLEKFNDIKEGDILEAFVMEEVER